MKQMVQNIQYRASKRGTNSEGVLWMNFELYVPIAENISNGFKQLMGCDSKLWHKYTPSPGLVV